MTNPVLEDDVVERLRAEKIDVRIPEMPFCTERVTRPVCEEAAALIERLQKELGEATNAVAIMTMRSGMHAEERDTIRAKTIEECAKVADQFAEVTAKLDGGVKSTIAAGMWNIAAAIRALNSNGGGKP